MTKYYVVEPEVAGGWGDHTQFTRVVGEPVVINRLHYRFDGWLGDDLLESTPCFIVTEKLAAEIIQSNLSGVNFEEVVVSKSPQFEETHPNFSLPNFLWMTLNGEPRRDDFGINNHLQLIVSSKALSILDRFKISHASISPIN